jgi:hypothetical protein
MSSDQVGGADVDSGRMLMPIADFKNLTNLASLEVLICGQMQTRQDWGEEVQHVNHSE